MNLQKIEAIAAARGYSVLNTWVAEHGDSDPGPYLTPFEIGDRIVRLTGKCKKSTSWVENWGNPKTGYECQ